MDGPDDHSNRLANDRLGASNGGADAGLLPSYDPVSRRKDDSTLLIDIIGQLSASANIAEREQRRRVIQQDLKAITVKVASDQMDALVEEHRENFFKALRAFVKVTDHISGCKAKADDIRVKLVDCKTQLQCNRPLVRSLWRETQEYTQMVLLLDHIEEIKTVPDAVDRMIKSRHHVHAAKLLVRTIGSLGQGEPLGKVTALSDLHRGLIARTDAMPVVLIKELQNHIYLKDGAGLTSTGPIAPLIGRQQLGTVPAEELEQPPAADPAAYLVLTVQALSVLNRIPDAVQGLRDSLKSELSLVIEKAIAYAEDKLLPDFTLNDGFTAGTKIAQALDQSGPGLLVQLLIYVYERMIRVFYSHAIVLAAIRRCKNGPKFLRGYPTFGSAAGGAARLGDVEGEAGSASSEGLAATGSARGKGGGTEQYDEALVWKAIQMETAVVLCQYLGIGEDVAVACFSPDPMVLTQALAKSRAQKRGGGPSAEQQPSEEAALGLFSFARSENAITETLVKKKDLLGHGAELGPPGSQKLASMLVDTYTSAEVSAVRLLCEASSLNIAGIFKPTVIFTDEIALMMTGMADSPEAKSAANALRAFVEGYVRYTFLSEVKTDVRDRVRAAVDMGERPTDDHDIPDAPRVMLKSALAIDDLVGQLAGLLLDLPHFANDFVKHILGALGLYWRAAVQGYNRLITVGPFREALHSGPVALAAEWAGNPALKQIMQASMDRFGDGPDAGSLDPSSRHTTASTEAAAPDVELGSSSDTEEGRLAQEVLKLVDGKLLHKHDTITDLQTLRSIANVHETFRWFADKITAVAGVISSKRLPRLSTLWHTVGPVVTVDPAEGPRSSSSGLAAEVDPEHGAKLRRVGHDFRELSGNALSVLALEVRCQVLLHLLPAVRKSSYHCEPEQIEADPQIVALCKDLIGLHELLSASLYLEDLDMIFGGLAEFIAAVLIDQLKHIKRVNDNGVKRMCRGIFGLQQTLSGITKTRAPALDRAMKYYELLYERPSEVVKRLYLARLFTEAEYVSLFELMANSQEWPDDHNEILAQLQDVFHNLV